MKKKASLLTTAVAVLVALVLNWAGLLPTAPNSGGSSPVPGTGSSSAGTISPAELPAQARQVISLIKSGGPFPYDKDGTVFQNREQLLPTRDRGYYREYTVKTPGERTRGARRIVAGGAKRTPDVMYYTADHYRSFRRIREERQ